MDDPATSYTHGFVRDALPPEARRLLEVGCGDGALAAALEAEGFALVAFDSDPDCVEAARARGVDARLAAWPDFDGGRFDAILFTRSLHHVGDLEAGVAAAFGCLEPGGRVIVEDFDAAFSDEPAFLWFAESLRRLAGAGLALDESPLLGRLARGDCAPVSAWRGDHDRHLHSAAAIEAVLRSRAASVRAEPAAYFFRYVARLPGASAPLVRSLLEAEELAVRNGKIAPLGRRFVAEG
jgi:SAM-dependent methyltransferase